MWPIDKHRVLERGVHYYFVHKGWVFLATPITILLVLNRLSEEQQGYYYTMMSFIAFQAIADLGFNMSLTHFVSHEWTHVHIEQGEIVGDRVARGRLASLVRIALAWSGLASVILLFGLGFTGYAFLSLSHPETQVAWRGAWWLLCLTLVPALLASTFRNIAEGCNNVAGSQKSTLWASIGGSVATWLGLVFGADLFVIAIGQFVTSVLTIILLIPHNRPLWTLCFTEGRAATVVIWWHEFWPHQWRIGISWLCGLAMFQSFVPFIFHFRGAVDAGQAGILLQGYALANVLGMAWVTNSQPHFGMAWAKRAFGNLKALNIVTRRRAIYTAAVAGAIGMIMLIVLKLALPQFGNRVGSATAGTILFFTCTIMQIANSETSAIRFGKKEVFLSNSIFGSIAVITSNYLLAPLGMEYVFFGFSAIMCLIVVPWVHTIYLRELRVRGQ